MELDEVEDIDALRVELAPLLDVRVDAGTWTLGGPGMDGILEWFSPEGMPRPELLRAMAVACRVAPHLVRRLIDEADCGTCGARNSTHRCCDKCGAFGW